MHTGMQATKQSHDKALVQRKSLHENRETAGPRSAFDNRESTLQLQRLARTVNDSPRLATQRKTTELMNRTPGATFSSPPSPSRSEVKGQPVMQRQVRNVTWNHSVVDVPGQQVIDQVTNQSNDIKFTKSTLKNAVASKFAWTGNFDRVDSVVGTTKGGRPNGQANGTSHTAKVGQMGRDDYRIRTGKQTSEAFEGGHLFGRALWDVNDDDAADMNKSNNLVPMSRGLNIYDYADQIETQMSGGTWRRWTVTPDWADYQVPEKHLAALLNLPLKAGRNGDGLLDFESWLPRKVDAQRGALVVTANENPFLSPNVQADDAAGLILLLKEKGLWNYLTKSLQDDVANL